MGVSGSRARLEADLERYEVTVRTHCVGLYGPALCALFVIGSYASGRRQVSSDLDLLVVIDESPVSRPQRAHDFGEPQDWNGPELSPIVFTRPEFTRMPTFLLSLLDAHVIWYSRGNEAQELLGAVVSYADRYGITRVPHKGGYYWRGIPAGS
jgi:hypothetical protein